MSSLFDPNILYSLLSETYNLSQDESRSLHPYKTKVNHSFVHFTETFIITL